MQKFFFLPLFLTLPLSILSLGCNNNCTFPFVRIHFGYDYDHYSNPVSYYNSIFNGFLTRLRNMYQTTQIAPISRGQAYDGYTYSTTPDCAYTTTSLTYNQISNYDMSDHNYRCLEGGSTPGL